MEKHGYLDECIFARVWVSMSRPICLEFSGTCSDRGIDACRELESPLELDLELRYEKPILTAN